MVVLQRGTSRKARPFSFWVASAAAAIGILSAGIATPFSSDAGQLPAVTSTELENLRQAAEQQDREAQYQLGLAYAAGYGVAQDFAAAVQWFRKAADQGLADAQNSLGVMYDNGTGVETDRQQALAWYRRAAEHGHAGAQNNLGLMYEIGRGVSLDYAEALKWYRLAAEQGWAAAQANLGLAYLGGVGVAPDMIEADKWLKIAVQRAEGDEQIRYNDLRESLERKMTAEDVVEAWQRAREWNRTFQRR